MSEEWAPTVRQRWYLGPLERRELPAEVEQAREDLLEASACGVVGCPVCS